MINKLYSEKMPNVAQGLILRDMITFLNPENIHNCCIMFKFVECQGASAQAFGPCRYEDSTEIQILLTKLNFEVVRDHFEIIMIRQSVVWSG